MILSFQHRGLRRLFEDDDHRGVSTEHVAKLQTILARLQFAARPEDMDLPAFRLHPLKGDLAGFWSMTVRANWRVIFRFEGANVKDVDLTDYH